MYSLPKAPSAAIKKSPNQQENASKAKPDFLEEIRKRAESPLASLKQVTEESKKTGGKPAKDEIEVSLAKNIEAVKVKEAQRIPVNKSSATSPLNFSQNWDSQRKEKEPPSSTKILTTLLEEGVKKPPSKTQSPALTKTDETQTINPNARELEKKLARRRAVFDSVKLDKPDDWNELKTNNKLAKQNSADSQSNTESTETNPPTPDSGPRTPGKGNR